MYEAPVKYLSYDHWHSYPMQKLYPLLIVFCSFAFLKDDYFNIFCYCLLLATSCLGLGPFLCSIEQQKTHHQESDMPPQFFLFSQKVQSTILVVLAYASTNYALLFPTSLPARNMLWQKRAV